MIKVKDIMSTDLITATPEMEITQAAALLLENRINGLPVIDDSGKIGRYHLPERRHCATEIAPNPLLFYLSGRLDNLDLDEEHGKRGE